MDWATWSAIGSCLIGVSLIILIGAVMDTWDDLCRHLDMSDEDWTHHL